MTRKKADVDDSSSDDEDNAEQLRQAVDGAFFTDDMFKNFNKNKKEVTAKQEAPKSQRNLNGAEPQVDVKVSAEMRRHLGDKLSTLIEGMVEYVDVKTIRKKGVQNQETEEGGVKLLRDSRGYLTTDAPKEMMLSRKGRKEVRKRIVLGEEDEESRDLQGVAVSPEYVLSGGGTKHWKERRRCRREGHRVEKYKAGPGGVLTLIKD